MRKGLERRILKEAVFNGTYSNDKSKSKKSYATVTPQTETNHERVLRQRDMKKLGWEKQDDKETSNAKRPTS